MRGQACDGLSDTIIINVYDDLLQGFLDSLYAAQAVTGQPLYHILLGCFGLLKGICHGMKRSIWKMMMDSMIDDHPRIYLVARD
jgi:hypothetical protein